jgi:hypothetical protein
MRLSWFSAVVGAVTANALPTITATGNKFFTSEGKQFFMKGIVMSQAGTVEKPVLTVGQVLPTNSHQVGANSLGVLTSRWPFV